MTELLKTIGEFLRDDATLGNLSAIVFGCAMLVKSWFELKVRNKLTLAKEEIAHKETDIAKLTSAVLLMGNMMTIAFGNSKLAPEVKIKLQENQDKIRDLIAGANVEVNKEIIEIKEEVVEKEEMTSTKSVLDQLKENL